MTSNVQALYSHKDVGTGTTITRKGDKATKTLTGALELQFLREVAYAAGSEALSFAQYEAAADAARAKYFNQ